MNIKLEQKSILNNCSILLKNKILITCFNYKIHGYHKHYIFGGKNKKNSKKYGLFMWLDIENYKFLNKFFSQYKSLDKALKEIAQESFMKKYPNLDFISIFGENYLKREKEYVNRKS